MSITKQRTSHALVFMLIFLSTSGNLLAQDLEPRSFSQAPTGMNFAVLAMGHAEGNMLFDQASTLEDVTGKVTSVGAGYVRTLDFFGVSAKALAILPVVWGDWDGRYQGNDAQASRRGIADPQVELSVNFVGAPAMTMKEMRAYNNKLVVGASLKVAIPLGQYDPEKLINLGTNRWSFRPRLGASYNSGPWTFEAMVSAWLFTSNDDFFGGALLEQSPLWSAQGNAVYQLPSRIWFGLGVGLSRGGQSQTNGIASDSYKKDTRWTAVMALPLNRQHSLKFVYTNGLRTRVGADFNQFTMAWSMWWGGM